MPLVHYFLKKKLIIISHDLIKYTKIILNKNQNMISTIKITYGCLENFLENFF